MGSARLSITLDRFSYPDGTVALADIRLDVARGEFTGILGANGSGKTTLLKVMDGLIRDYSGRVLLDGADERNSAVADAVARIGQLAA